MRIQHTTYRKIIAVLILLGCTCQLSAQGKTYHVKADSEITASGNDGLSWDKAITLTEALNKAKAGDEIWVKGYEDITGHIYKAPEEGFVLPSGVAMYGGFAGDENNKNDLPTGRHKYQMKYQKAPDRSCHHDACRKARQAPLHHLIQLPPEEKHHGSPQGSSQKRDCQPLHYLAAYHTQHHPKHHLSLFYHIILLICLKIRKNTTNY